MFAAPVSAAGGPGSERLVDLLSRAHDRTTWPALRDLAERTTDVEQRGRTYFVVGYRAYEANDFKSAARDLAAAAETGFSLSDYAHYFGAKAARDAGDFPQAVDLLKDFSSRFPHSTLRWSALENFSNLLVDMKQPDRALKALLQEPQVHQRPHLSLVLGEAYRASGNLKQAVRVFQEIYYRFPLSSEADEAEAALTELRKQLGAKYPEASEESKASRADVFSRNSRWRQASEEYGSLLKQFPKSTLASRWKLGRGKALLRLRKTDQAVELLKTGIEPSPQTDPERLALLVQAAFRKGGLEEAENFLSQLKQSYPQSLNYADALDSFGNYYVRRGDWQTAAIYYQVLADHFPSTDEGQEAQWRRTWAFYLDGDLTRARVGFTQHVIRYADSDHVPGAFYWLGRIDEQRGAIEEAKYWYSFLTHRFVHSYYAAKAEIRMEEIRKSPAFGRHAEPSPASYRSLAARIPQRARPGLPSCGETDASDALETYWVLRNLGLSDLAKDYLLARLGEQEAPTSALRYALSRHRAEEGAVTHALFDARRSEPRYVEFQFEELPKEFWALLYPREFLPIIERYAEENNLDVPLVLGLIRQESAFNPKARSVANARGLMQILPQTVSRTRRGRRTAARRLLDPDYNVRFGTGYLRGRLSVLGEIPEQALAAYHAGDRRVREWLTPHNFQEPAEFLETIPIPSTRTYVEAALRDAGIYRKLLDGSAQFAQCQGAGVPSAMQQKGPLGPEAMNRLPKALILIPLVLILFAPIAVGITFLLAPLWLWIELHFQIESIGHSAPAEWCFVAIYLAFVMITLGTLILLSRTRPKTMALTDKR